MPQSHRQLTPAPTFVHRYLDAVVRLTAQRDLPALAAIMQSSLAELIPADRHRLLLLLREPAEAAARLEAYDLLASETSVISLLDDSELTPCIYAGRTLGFGRDTNRRWVLPIGGSIPPTALLVMENVKGADVDSELLVKLVLIYLNQVALLQRNEKDPLTGLYNRQAFDARIKNSVQNAGRRRRDASSEPEARRHCFALIDIDHFKQVNDRFGHLFGDEILILMTRLMTECFRTEDSLFRYGGEEFAVLLTDTDTDGAMTALERFRQAVERYPFPQVGTKTVSIGMVAIQPGDTVENIVARADKALYYAKNHGRNRLDRYEALVASGELAPVSVATGDVELF